MQLTINVHLTINRATYKMRYYPTLVKSISLLQVGKSKLFAKCQKSDLDFKKGFGLLQSIFIIVSGPSCA